MNDWHPSLINKIFAEKKQEESEDRDNLLHLTSKSLYGEKIHYVLELIQNAEDEGSSTITFIFSADNVAIINDGRSFNEKDVWGICSVKPGRKKNKLGFFGIGFKSVFNITERPQIISDKFNFELEKYIYPKNKTSIPEDLKKYYSPKRGAIFVLPYSSETLTPNELIKNFNSIDDKILLFLENLRELKFVNNIISSEWEIKKNLRKDSKVSLFDTRSGEETIWRVFQRNIQVDDEEVIPKEKKGIKETCITIAFPNDSTVRDKIKKGGVVYCYLPTKQRTDLPFLIQADFLPTIGRENISDHPWNVWLMEKLGNLAADAIDEIKDDGQICDSLYDFIPLSEEIQDDLIKHLYISLFETLKEKEIAKTTKGWLKPANCVIPSDDRLRDILTEADLKLLFQKSVFYTDRDLAEDDHFTRAEKVLFELGVKKIESKEVVEFLQEEKEIKWKNKEWFLNLYDYFKMAFNTDGRWKWDEDATVLYEKLQKSKFILTDDNKLVSLKDPQIPDRLICYPQSIDISEIHQLFSEGEIVFLHRYFQESSIVHRKGDDDETEEKRKRVKEWFNSIGVKKYFKQHHIIEEVILPKFITGKYKEYDDLKLYKLVDYIRTYWSTIESEITNKKLSPNFIEEVKNSLMLKVFKYNDGNKIGEYRRPDEIYFSKRYGKNEAMEDLFEGIEDIYFVSPYYLNKEKREAKKKKRGRQKVEYTWKELFEIFGVWSSPRVVKSYDELDIGYSNPEYEWVDRKYSNQGLHKIRGDSQSHDIKKLVEYCAKINDPTIAQKRMTLLWESLKKNWSFYKGKGYFETEYGWYDYKWRFESRDSSSFLEFLRNASWILRKDGGFSKPSEVFADTEKNRFLLGNDVKYINFKANETFLKDLGVQIEPETEKVIDHIKAYREENLHPKENKIEKMKAIYDFLQDKLNGLEDSNDRNSKGQEIKKIFNEYELLYLPREDKSWWKPSCVFWKDFFETFKTLRGYIEQNGSLSFYNATLKDFFLSLGVVEKPLLKECFDILEDLKGKRDLDYYKKFAPKIYVYINELIEQSVGEATDWDRAVFLSEKGYFLSPQGLYYSDNNEYKNYFEVKIEILWLPFSWSNIKNMLQIGGFKKLSQFISITKKFDNLNEIEGDTTDQLVQRLLYVENYLKKMNVGLYEDLHKEGVFNKIKKLQAYETSKIILDYLLKIDNSEPVVIKNVEKEAYFSSEENRIYKLSQINLFSTAVAKELSELFVPGGDDVLPLLDSFFSTVDEEELREKLKYFGIQVMDTFMEEPSEEIKLIPFRKEMEQKLELKKEEEHKHPKDIPEKPQLPKSEHDAERFDLINPDEFVFDKIEKRTPYRKMDGIPNIPPSIVTLGEGQLGTGKTEQKPREKVNRVDAEAIALEMVMKFEEGEGRKPQDRHRQRRIGYDIYSETESKEERFIEVKHFRGEAGAWELTPHEWEKGEHENDKYFVYVVSRLKEGNSPVIEIIQNPNEYLLPDPPVQKKFSDWENAVAKKVTTYRKV